MNFFNNVSKRISPYMKSKGFSLIKKNYYFIANDIAYCVAFDVPSGLLYVTTYIIPLYIPCKGRYYTYGNRLSAISNSALQPLRKDADPDTIDAWCAAFMQSIENIVMPFFEQVRSPQELVDYTETHSYGADSPIACHEVYIWRLKMFTYFYLCNFAQARKAATHYQDILLGCTFLTDAVRQKYVHEIDMLRSLPESDTPVQDYFKQISLETIIELD